VRLLLALAALEQWHLQAVDVKTAFLYGKLDEELYMRQPEGFFVKGKENLVWRLNRAIYGLKQAALSWWKELEASMK
jgi:Reverse transcriptase (RNA-dependent DNA polymerase)